MEYLQTVLTTVWGYFMTPLNIYGYTVQYGVVYLWIILSGFVVWGIKYFLFD